MTVRTWFRLQRAALHAQPTGLWGDLDRLVTRVLAGQPLDRWESVGEVCIIFDREGWDRGTRLVQAIRDRMDQARDELEQELQRRAALNARIQRHLNN